MTSSGLSTVLAKQRRPLLVGLLLSVGVAWIALPSGNPQLALFFAAGVLLSLLNHVLTELSLYRSLDQGTELTRKQFALGAVGRLAIVTVLALALAAVFWPSGAVVLVGLAVMHLVMIVFTGLPLLNEMRNV